MTDEYKPSYRPGHRRKDLKLTGATPRKFSETRYAWARVLMGQFVILVGDESNQTGNDVVLFHPRPGNIPALSIVLTDMTELELDALKSIFDSAFEWARPVVKIRDEEAKRAYENGDDSVTRIYRQVPQLVYRKRPEPEHYEGLLQRPEDVSSGSGGDGSQSRGVRGTGDGLAEPDERQDESEDDRPSAD